MSNAIKIYQGRFGRVALLDMNAPLVQHAHHHCHLLIKASGPDTFFVVQDVPQALTSETAVLVNPWEIHAYRHNSNEKNTIILALYIETDWLSQVQHPIGGGGHPQYFPSHCVKMSSHALKLAEELILEMWWSDCVTAERLEIVLCDLLISVVDPGRQWRDFSRQMEMASRRPSDPRIRKAIACMRDNMADELDMGKIAEYCGLSRAHFFARFYRCAGVTPNVYLNVLRMEKAIQNLSNSHSTLANISGDLGFSAQAHFTRFFRQHLGIKPSEYRRIVELYASDQDPVEI